LPEAVIFPEISTFPETSKRPKTDKKLLTVPPVFSIKIVLAIAVVKYSSSSNTKPALKTLLSKSTKADEENFGSLTILVIIPPALVTLDGVPFISKVIELPVSSLSGKFFSNNNFFRK